MALKVASMEVIKTGMLWTLAMPAISANLHSLLALFCVGFMMVFLGDDFFKNENSLCDDFLLNLDLILTNPKTVRIDLNVIFQLEASLNTPTNHIIIITQDNTIKHTG